MNGDEDMDYQDDDNQYYDEGEEVYEDFEDTDQEYIKVNGRYIPYNSNADQQPQQRQQQQHQQQQPSTSTQRSFPNAPLLPPTKHLPTQMLEHKVKIESSGPLIRKVELAPPTAKSGVILPGNTRNALPSQAPPYYGRPVVKPPPAIRKPLTCEMVYPISQQKAFYEMKEQVQLAKQKTKKKLLAPGQKKPCNCTKSQCLKLYCDCFANGEFCRDCNCKDCHNNINYDESRTKAIRQSLERNPNAFKPKIGIAKAGVTDIERLHQKGCHCKKSGCLKNYCECYEAKVPCTDRCKCKGCQNTEAYRQSKYKGGSNATAFLSMNSGTATPDSRESSVPTDESNDYDDIYPTKPQVEKDPSKFPWFYMTDEVVEAATLCMVAQADEVLLTSKDMPAEECNIHMERLILQEFGRCLSQIITNATEPSTEQPNA